MSMTHSRGLHTAGRWATVAAGGAEALAARNFDPAKFPQGLFPALKRFFEMVLTGVAEAQGKENHASSGYTSYGMEGCCALEIARGVLTATRKRDKAVTLPMIKRATKSYMTLLRSLQQGKTTVNSSVKRELQAFLTELARQGENDRETKRYQDDDGD